MYFVYMQNDFNVNIVRQTTKFLMLSENKKYHC